MRPIAAPQGFVPGVARAGRVIAIVIPPLP